MMQSTLLTNSAFASLNLFPSVPTHLPPRQAKLHSVKPSNTSRQQPPVPSRQSSLTLGSPISDIIGEDQRADILDPQTMSPIPAQIPRTPDISAKASPILLDSPLSPRSPRSTRSWSTISQRGLRSVSVMDFGSPCAITAEEEAVSQPGNVFLGKQRLMNWARPFKGDEKEDVHIFGQSIQRTRRLNRHVRSASAEIAFPSPSSSSSDDDTPPVTPSVEVDLPGRSWSIATSMTGLGVKGIQDFEDFNIPALSLSAIDEAVATEPTRTVVDISTSPSASSIELGSPIAFPAVPLVSHRRQSTAPPRLLSTSQSLDALASPGSLAELRQLQKVVVDIEAAARQPLKLSLPVENDKRIRRKAVPPVLESPLEEAKLGSPSKAALRRKAVPLYLESDVEGSHKMPLSATIFTLAVESPVHIARSGSNSSTSSQYLGDRSESSSINSSPRLDSATPSHTNTLPDTARPSPMRSFYANAKATMSMFDISPRTVSLPIVVPPRLASKTPGHTRSSSQPTPVINSVAPIARKDSGSGYSSSGDSWDTPITPRSFASAISGDDIKVRIGGNGFQFAPAPSKVKKNGIYGNKSAFISQLDLGLKKVLDKKSGDGSNKHRRGLSRFFGFKA